MNDVEKVLEQVRLLNPRSDSLHVVNLHKDFLGGALYVIGFERDGDQFHNFVFLDKDELHVAKNDALLISMISKRYKKETLLDSLGGVAGIIGLAVTATIIYLLINNPLAEIPQILSAALTTILGFYFGSQTTRK